MCVRICRSCIVVARVDCFRVGCYLLFVSFAFLLLCVCVLTRVSSFICLVVFEFVYASVSVFACARLYSFAFVSS